MGKIFVPLNPSAYILLMPGYLPNKGRACACGCGLSVKLHYDGSGRFKGYGKFAPNCQRIRPKRVVRNRRKDRVPVGTRRLHNSGSDLFYWQIKIGNGRSGWVYEHRYVMEQQIGRKLRSDEHVHHIDENGLNNDPTNLRLISPAEHTREHHAIQTWAIVFDRCVECATTERKHISHGLCSACYQRHFKREIQKRVCRECNEFRYASAKGLCRTCYARQQRKASRKGA